MENWIVDAHFVSHSGANEHGIVVKHGVENEIKFTRFGNVNNKLAHTFEIIIFWKHATMCALGYFEK